MKTGTTYLQDLMQANRRELADAGFLFPGDRWADQSLAVQDVLGFGADDPRALAATRGRWAAMASEMLEHRGTASILSMEFLSFADTDAAERVVTSLADADVHVVLTVRDAARTIPAQWQTACRNGGKVPYRRFVYGVRAALDPDQEAGGRAAQMFRRTQGVTRMLDVWVPLVGKNRVHVVTVPPPGSDPKLLWRRFAEVVGVPPEVAVRPVPNNNTSLGHASTELLRLVNAEIGKIPRLDYIAVIKGPLARKILGTRATQEAPLRLHRRGHAFAARWNGRVRASFAAHDVHVVGDLDDLPTARPAPDLPKTLAQPGDRELLAAAATARDGLHEYLDHLRVTLETRDPGPQKPAQTFDPSGDWSTTTAKHWDAHAEPVAAAVAELAEIIREGVSLARRIDEQREAALVGSRAQSAATAAR
jgi:hypothetical protein